MRTLAVLAVASAALLGSLALAPSASAAPVTMNFCVQSMGGGQYQYTFTLTLDNHDNTWNPGYGIGGIIFADSSLGPSPLDDFIGDPASLPIGPWSGYSPTSGGHNGTSLYPIAVEQPPYPIVYWVPNAVGDSLTWRGTSSHLVTQLQWSTLFATGGPYVNFQFMTSTNCANTGACCLTTGCQVTTATGCAAAGGSFAGNGTQCTSCPTIGACCSATGCSIITQAACTGSGGQYLGDNSTCPSPSYSVSNSGGAFVDISTTGTLEPITSGCDDCAVSVPLPFSFLFYGNGYSNVTICSNGNLQFGGSVSDYGYENDAIPTASTPNNAIYPCWDDLYPLGQGDVYYKTDGVAPNRRFTVAWIDCNEYSTGPALTFEAILYEGSNNIEFRYGDMPADVGGGSGPGGSDYTIGVENASGTAAVSILGSSIGTGHTARMLTYVPSTCGSACGSADFDCDGDTATDFDIEAFFRCIAGNCPAAPCVSTADFDADGDSATDADIEAFFRVLAGGHC